MDNWSMAISDMHMIYLSNVRKVHGKKNDMRLFVRILYA